MTQTYDKIFKKRNAVTTDDLPDRRPAVKTNPMNIIHNLFDRFLKRAIIAKWNNDQSALILNLFGLPFRLPAILVKITGIEALRLAQLRHREENNIANRRQIGDAHRSRISKFREYQKTRKAKRVIYTCITNDYDDLYAIACPGYIDDNCDYICFTDNRCDISSKRIGIWDIRPLVFTERDNTRNNRWHKMHPHTLFPENSDSIYIDANINILTNHLFRTISSRNSPLLAPWHPVRQNIYDEFTLVRNLRMDNAELVDAEERLVRDSGMPENYGMTEMNIIYRRHNDPTIISLDEEWWRMIRDYAKRDQLSFTWLLWKRGIAVGDIAIDNARNDTVNYILINHKRVFSK